MISREGWVCAILAACVAVVVCVPVVHGAAKGPSSAMVKAEFRSILARLDTDGELLLIMNVDGLLEELMDGLVKGAEAVPKENADVQPVIEMIPKLRGFLKKNGFYAVRGVGMSVVPREDGLNNIKTFVSRDPQVAKLPFWRGLVGMAPRKLVCLEFLPKDTVMFRASIADPRMFWKLVRPAVADLTSADQLASFEQSLEAVTVILGISVDDLVASLGDESFISVQLSATQTIDLGPESGMPPIPAPSLLIGLAVQDDTLHKLIETRLASFGMPLMKLPVNDIMLQSLTLPLPIPIPLQITFAMTDGFLLIGTSAQVVNDAVVAKAQKNGLIVQPEFKKVFAGLPMVHNVSTFMSARFVEVMTNIQKESLKRMSERRDQNMAFVEAMTKIMPQQEPAPAASVTVNLKSGILTRSVSSQGGKEVIVGAMIAPIGMMAAIAVPRFIRARGTSRGAACINNLRQLDAGKEQWAMAEGKNDGDAPDVEGVCEYIKGNAMPICPQGGVYSLNAIGVDPTCSSPRHSLRGWSGRGSL